jgi:transposase-like protein
VHAAKNIPAKAEWQHPHEDACKAYLQARRWPEGPGCPRCGNPAVYDLPSRKWHWQCEKCTRDGYRFSILVGTIFENTNKPLRDWFRVAHLMLTSKKGMSALQIMRYMGFGSYKTAWEMCHKIRVALMEDIEKLGGIVEVDETEVGGKDRSRHWDKRDHREFSMAKRPKPVHQLTVKQFKELFDEWKNTTTVELSVKSGGEACQVRNNSPIFLIRGCPNLSRGRCFAR